MPEALMLFAAGFGKRMLPLTAALPKPMIPVAGKPLIDHALAQADALPLKRKVVNLHYLPQPIIRHLGHRRDLTLVTESPEILETGGGLRNALPWLGPEPVFTLNTDAVWVGANPLRVLADHWDPARMDALLLLAPAAQALGHSGSGDFALDPQGRISRAPGEVRDWIYLGSMILCTEELADVPDRVFSMNLVWDRMIAGGRAFGIAYPGQWCDVGRPESIPLAEALVRAGADV